MSHFTRCAFVAVACNAILSASAAAQVLPKRTFEQIDSLMAAHGADFDYMLGDWDFRGVNPNGPFRGHWSVAKLGDGGRILDEFRLLDDKDLTVFVSLTIRAYNAVRDRWDFVSIDDRGTGLDNVGTASRDGDTVRVLQTFGIGTPNSWTSRIRYYDIRPTSFRWIADRSYDGGKTWVKDYQRIEAHRVGPPRVMAPFWMPAAKSKP